MENNRWWSAQSSLCEGEQDMQDEIKEMREHLLEEDGNEAEDEEDWLWPSPRSLALSSPTPSTENIRYATQALELVPARWGHDVARAETIMDSLQSASHDSQVASADGSHAVGSHDDLAVSAFSSSPHVFADESYVDHSLDPPSTSTDSTHPRNSHLRLDVSELSPKQATEVGFQRNQVRKTRLQSGRQQKSVMVSQHDRSPTQAVDTSVIDTSVVDTSVVDTSVVDTSVVDTSVINTSVINTSA
ncbi:hypothetical protein WOLCODRAFT_161931, partial [Wolfiporia cocos MD-104 SS10]